VQLNEFAHRRIWGPRPSYENVLNYIRPNKDFTIIAGPCSVENQMQIEYLASIAKQSGATHLRGGVFRAGTFPGKNFGLIEKDLVKQYHEAARSNNLKNIIEVLNYSTHELDWVAQYADCFQVGCRQMQNYQLLRTLGYYKKPVFLKRHPGSTIDEFLGAAEHLLVGGVNELTLIERGSSGHSSHVRWDLSISMIPAVKAITALPILVDPSHGTGRRDLVWPMALAGIAAGADGALIEFHENPELSLSDSDQAISIYEFQTLMEKIKELRGVL